MLRLCTFVLVLLCLLPSARAESYIEIRERKPSLFHPETGLRIARQRAPVPDDIPWPITKVSAPEAAALIELGAVALDVFGALQSRYDELDGTWLVGKKRMSIPGAVWLPEVGRGTLAPDMALYLKSNLERLTGGKLDHPIVAFCVSDCWMSWNAAQHIVALGYTRVSWFNLGTDGWLESGRSLKQVDPVPVKVD